MGDPLSLHKHATQKSEDICRRVRLKRFVDDEFIRVNTVAQEQTRGVRQRKNDEIDDYNVGQLGR